MQSSKPWLHGFRLLLLTQAGIRRPSEMDSAAFSFPWTIPKRLLQRYSGFSAIRLWQPLWEHPEGPLFQSALQTKL